MVNKRFSVCRFKIKNKNYNATSKKSALNDLLIFQTSCVTGIVIRTRKNIFPFKNSHTPPFPELTRELSSFLNSFQFPNSSIPPSTNNCPYRFPSDKPQQVPLCVHIKNDDGHMVFPAKGKGGQVHDLQPLFVSFVEGEGVKFRG